jgi:hypothetical protein
MTKEQLIDLARKILDAEAALDFMSTLDQRELEILIACIRERIEQKKAIHIHQKSFASLQALFWEECWPNNASPASKPSTALLLPPSLKCRGPQVLNPRARDRQVN